MKTKIFFLFFFIFSPYLIFGEVSLNYLNTIKTYANDVAVLNNVLYVAQEARGIHSYNISDINNIKEITTSNDGLWSIRLKIFNNYLFSACGYDGLAIYDISSISKIQRISFIETNSGVCNFTISGDYLFAGGYGEVYIIDISDLSNPKLIKTIDINDWSCGIATKDNYLYVITSNKSYKIIVYDISDIKNPIKIYEGSSYDLNNDIKIYNNYLIGSGFGLTVYDITNNSPQLIFYSTVSSMSTSDKVLIYNNKIFSSKIGGLYIFDSENKFNLIAKKEYSYESIPEPYSSGVTVNNHYIFYARGYLGIDIFDMPDNWSSNINYNQHSQHFFLKAGNEASDGIITEKENLNIYFDYIPTDTWDKNIFLGIYISTFPDVIFAIKANNEIEKISLNDISKFPPYRVALSSSEFGTLTIFENIPARNLPEGEYTFYTLVSNYHGGESIKDIDFSNKNEYELYEFNFTVKHN